MSDHAPRLYALILTMGFLFAGCQRQEIVILPDSNSAVATETPLPAPAVSVKRSVATSIGERAAEPTTAARETPAPAPTPSIVRPSPTSPPADRWQLGSSPSGQSLVAHKIGDGPIHVVVVGYQHHAAADILAAYQAAPEAVPPEVSLWILPDLNPDGPGRGVDLRRNAQTSLSGCPGNGWSPDPDGQPGGGGKHPFSEPESRALDQLLQTAWMVLFLEEARSPALLRPRLIPAACRDFAANNRLATVVAADAGLSIARAQADSGNWIDYLAGEGIAAARIELPGDVDLDVTRAAVRAMLAHHQSILAGPAGVVGAELEWLDERNTGSWSLAPGTTVYPLALAPWQDGLYVLDSGQVLRLGLQPPHGPPQRVLQPGQPASNEWVTVPVQDPVDLIGIEDGLLVLDRVADIYRYQGGEWYIERYDRPISDTSSHYFTAMASAEQRYLLESSYDYINSYQVPYNGDGGWLIEENHDVDIAALEDQLFLLYRQLETPHGGLVRYVMEDGDTRRDRRFRTNAPIFRPRQAVLTQDTLYVLDRAGYRLMAIDPTTGALLRIYQFARRRQVSALWASPDGSRVLLAGQDRIFFLHEPEQKAQVPGADDVLWHNPLHDPTILRSLRGLLKPIAGTPLTRRDLQMPGAPRHYRLGVHEGVDFYWAQGTEVRSAADGTVIRAMHTYTTPDPQQIETWRSQSWAAGFTPEDALDGFRGQQVWIQGDDGFVTRYVHLGGIAPEVKLGERVSRGQLIAYVGNSGSPGSTVSEDEDAHLHFELWLGGQYLGQYLHPIDTREWLEMIFTP